MENKLLQIQMIMWLGIGIACIILGIYSLVTQDFEKAGLFGLFTVIAAILFSLRRYQYKNKQKREMSAGPPKNS